MPTYMNESETVINLIDKNGKGVRISRQMAKIIKQQHTVKV